MDRVFRKEHLKVSVEYSADQCVHVKNLRERERTTHEG